jgi:tetratricopeptide (TPR) repeat protein
MDRILTQGQKIKKARKKLGAKQRELTNGGLTRNFISMAENDKSGLTYSSAHDICECIQHIAIKKEINMDYFTTEYLLETLPFQVNRVLDEYIEEFKEYKSKSLEFKFTRRLKETEYIINSHYADVYSTTLLSIYLLLGDVFSKHFFSEQALHYYERACEISMLLKSPDAYVDAKTKMIRIYLEKCKYDEVINNGKLALNILSSQNIESEIFYKKINFNMALAYKKVHNYNKCLKHLNTLENKYKLTYEQYIDVKMLKANSYLLMEKFDKAEKIYNEIMQLAKENNDQNNIAKINNNMCKLEATKGNLEKAKSYLETSLSLTSFRSLKDKAVTYRIRTDLCVTLELSDKVINYYLETLDILELINDLWNERELTNIVYSYFEKQEDIKNIESILNVLENRFYNNGKLTYITDVFARAINYFMSIDNEKAAIYSGKQNVFLKRIANGTGY